MKTLILLIDFYGHPALTTDSYSDSIRYSHLTEIISSSFIDRKNCIFFSTPIDHTDIRLLELKKIAIANHFTFVSIEDQINNDREYTIDYVKLKLKNFININNTDTQIIVTGTNTSGCVFKNKNIGAYHWSKAGYKTKIYLPMCIEHEHKGINDFERNLYGFAQLYKHIKEHSCFEIEICKEFSDLELPI